MKIVGQVGGDRETKKTGDGNIHERKFSPQVIDVSRDAAATDHVQLTALFELRYAGLDGVEAPHSEISPMGP